MASPPSTDPELARLLYRCAHLTGRIPPALRGREPGVLRTALRDRGAEIVAVLCVIDREVGGRESLAAEQLALRSLFTISQLRRAGEGVRAYRLTVPRLRSPPADRSCDHD